MKTKIILSCLVATTLVSTSCSDFLTEDPKGQLTPSNFLCRRMLWMLVSILFMLK